MGPIAMVARARLRRRRAASLALVVLVGIAGGAFLAAVAGARRTASSLERFQDASRAAEFEIDAGTPTDAQIRRFAATPGVTAVGRLRQLALFNDDLGFLPIAGPLDDRFGRDVDRARLVAGRDARAVDELVVGEGLVERFGLGIGDRLRFRSFTQAQIDTDELDDGTFDPRGPSVELRIVGVVRRPLDLGARGEAGGVIVPTRAFVERYRDEIGSFTGTILRVRTEDGPADGPRVAAAARRAFGGFDGYAFHTADVEGAGAASAIHVSAAALWALAGITAFAGAVAVGLALARSMAADADDQASLRALGLRPVQRWAASAATAIPVAVAGALVAALVAVGASPLFPIGVARDAEPDPGLAVDGVALVLGVVVVAAAVLVVGAAGALSVTRRAARGDSARLVSARAEITRALPPSASVGIGFAFERGRGRRAVPVWSTLGAVAMGTVGVVAALVFGASLHSLTTTPAEYGWTWDVADFGPPGTDRACPGDLDPAGAAAVAALCFRGVSVQGNETSAWTLRPVRGRIPPPIVAGRAPMSGREVALGAELLEATGTSIGDAVRIAGPRGTRSFRIVGRTVLPGVGDPQPLAGSVLVDPVGMRRLGGAEDNYAVFRLADGADLAAFVRALDARDGDVKPAVATLPAEIERIQQIRRVPVLLALLTAVVALSAVAFTLVVSVHRRGRDLAVMKTIGFGRAQVRATVAWQATTLALTGVVVGLVLGVVVGRVVWHEVAANLGIGASVDVPLVRVLLVLPLALLLVNGIAAIPARSAARTPAAVLLRSE